MDRSECRSRRRRCRRRRRSTRTRRCRRRGRRHRSTTAFSKRPARRPASRPSRRPSWAYPSSATRSSASTWTPSISAPASTTPLVSPVVVVDRVDSHSNAHRFLSHARTPNRQLTPRLSGAFTTTTTPCARRGRYRRLDACIRVRIATHARTSSPCLALHRATPHRSTLR